MAFATAFTDPAPAPEDLADLPGTVAVEFGVDWCPHCQAAQPVFRGALQDRRDITHIKIEDGPGRKLGRHFKVKLWPTLVVLRNGQEIGRTTRPQSIQEVEEQLPVAI
ncbi:thioredoxin family protein [Comamonas avium]|uniref:Thioredoxin family protein n=1 Tax=Comamonas avium TaxID=2762231 RepID=A0ABR8SFX9_9BURK|nr:thioredoxin family protein [Comamonas avium]MBD7962357.1 thioredoxin family protein [Comamonas avium]